MPNPKPDTPKPPEPNEQPAPEAPERIADLVTELSQEVAQLSDRGWLQELKIADEKVAVKKRQLEVIVRRYEEKEAELKSEEDRKREDLRDLDELIDLKQTELTKFDKAIREAKNDLAAPRKEVAALKEEIRDRRAYLYEQEDLIAKAVDEGSDKIRATYNELDELSVVKANLLSYNLEVEAKNNRARDEYQSLVDKTQIYKEQSDAQRATLSDSLAELRKQIASEAEPLAKARREVEAGLKRIKVRELELDKQKQALEAYDKDLQARELRFKSNQAIYKF